MKIYSSNFFQNISPSIRVDGKEFNDHAIDFDCHP